MKIFALCALFAAAAASICDQAGSSAKNLDSTVIGLQVLLDNSVMAGCNPGGDTFSNFVFGNANCKAIFDQGFCYMNVGKDKYESYDSKSVTWDLVVSGIPNAKAFGQVLCANTEACYTPVKDALLECYEDPVFAAEVTASAQAAFAYAAESGSAYSAENQGVIASSLTNMVLSRFGSFEDALSAYNENSDALSEAYQVIIDTASDFCEQQCVEQTADYLSPFLAAIQDKKCSNVNKFCGRCQANAQAYVNDNGLPCCLTNVIDGAIQNIDDFKVTYAAQIQAYTDEAFASVTKSEKKKAERAYNELLCLRAMYNGRAGDCTDYSA